MAYTPELSQESACNLRRFAWALGLPMTEAIQIVFTELLPQIIENKNVCDLCKDTSRCEMCGFDKQKKDENSLYIIEEKENTGKKAKRIIKKKCA
jgi:recombinational DNA repair protein RecR